MDCPGTWRASACVMPAGAGYMWCDTGGTHNPVAKARQIIDKINILLLVPTSQHHVAFSMVSGNLLRRPTNIGRKAA